MTLIHGFAREFADEKRSLAAEVTLRPASAFDLGQTCANRNQGKIRVKAK
jgi:hypothetical protein